MPLVMDWLSAFQLMVEYIEHTVDRALVSVLHALAESAAPTGHSRETNPGKFRTDVTRWEDQPINFAHPPAEEVSDLVDEALHVVNRADAPTCVLAAWLVFAMLSIHPFVDGNGRTSRDILKWAPRPHSRRTFEHPDPFGLIIA